MQAHQVYTNLGAYPLPLLGDLNLGMIEDEVNSPHFGNNRSKAHKVAKRLGPSTELHMVRFTNETVKHAKIVRCGISYITSKRHEKGILGWKDKEDD